MASPTSMGLFVLVVRARSSSSTVVLSLRYDLMNDVMSGTVHRAWKDYFVDLIGPVLSKGTLADLVACRSSYAAFQAKLSFTQLQLPVLWMLLTFFCTVS